ncbi:hypothetical protein V1522DRAFT_416961, partial [Lipomyces starkeyi]
MRSYDPEKVFDESGKLIPELKELAPQGNRRMSANPVANGALLKKPLHMPDFRNYAIEVHRGGTIEAPSMSNMAIFLRDIIAANQTNFRLLTRPSPTSLVAFTKLAKSLD